MPTTPASTLWVQSIGRHTAVDTSVAIWIVTQRKQQQRRREQDSLENREGEHVSLEIHTPSIAERKTLQPQYGATAVRQASTTMLLHLLERAHCKEWLAIQGFFFPNTHFWLLVRCGKTKSQN